MAEIIRLLSALPSALVGGVTPPPPHSKSIPSTGCGMGTMVRDASLFFFRTYHTVPTINDPPNSAMARPAASS